MIITSFDFTFDTSSYLQNNDKENHVYDDLMSDRASQIIFNAELSASAKTVFPTATLT